MVDCCEGKFVRIRYSLLCRCLVYIRKYTPLQSKNKVNDTDNFYISEKTLY